MRRTPPSRSSTGPTRKARASHPPCCARASMPACSRGLCLFPRGPGGHQARRRAGAHRLQGQGQGRRHQVQAMFELHIEQGPILEAERQDDRRRHRRAGHALVRGDGEGPGIAHGRHAHGPAPECAAGRCPHDRGDPPGRHGQLPAVASVGLSRCGRTAATWCRAKCSSPWTCATRMRRCWMRWRPPSRPPSEDRRRNGRGGRGKAHLDFTGREVRRGHDQGRAQGAEKAGFSTREMVSGAGHDAAYIARVAPTTMIFVPCLGGISHNEAESTRRRNAGQAPRCCSRRCSPDRTRDTGRSSPGD